jgi:hypothetical protein
MRTAWRDLTLSGALVLALVGCGAKPEASKLVESVFDTPEAAVAAFVEAARTNNTAALETMLGPGSAQIVTSSDTIADNLERSRFVKGYDVKHVLAASGPDEITLIVGNSDWPLPIPLEKTDGKWRWNGAAGAKEVYYRRIGHNELGAISALKGVVEAQDEYAMESHDGKPRGSYAQYIVSRPGLQNGLYWATKEGEPQSPMGPAIAQAGSEGYDTTGARTPYHGYFYRMLPNGRGWGMVAYPSDYRVTGVMTFQVSQTGVIFQKDLGDSTSVDAPALTKYAVDSTWTVTQAATGDPDS